VFPITKPFLPLQITQTQTHGTIWRYRKQPIATTTQARKTLPMKNGQACAKHLI